MRVHSLWILCCCASLAAQLPPPLPPGPASLTIHPAAIALDDARDRHRIVIVATYADGTTRDVTMDSEVVLEDPTVAGLDGQAAVYPEGDGETVLSATFAGRSARVAVTVRNAARRPAVSYANEVVPVLTRAGCNAGSCHGSAAGKNGFHLSLFGYDKATDHRTLTRELRGRRVNPAAPESSLMLLKPTNSIAHKGGKRLDRDGDHYRTLREWVAAGAQNDLASAPELTGIEIRPARAVLAGPGQRQRFVVTARYSDGSDRDVTGLALMSSSDDVAARVAEDGSVESGQPGETFVLARFGTFAEVAQVLVVADPAPVDWPEDVEPTNYIDSAIFGKLRMQRLLPADVCDDGTFLRRAFLDIVGVLPTPDEARRFLADDAPDKRTRLVDDLLQRPEFPDVWAMQWAEVLRVESRRLERKGMFVYSEYLREAFRNNRPFDEVVRELLTGSGPSFSEPTANFYVVESNPRQIAENVAQVFLGVRIQCAQCHNHPFERWTMDDYYGFAAFFTQVGIKRGEDRRERIVIPRESGDIRHPVTRAVAKPKFLGGSEPEIPRGADRRAVLAEWLTSDDNPMFARNVANRVFARFFGRGIVEPTDDVRVSNPPSHPELHRLLGEKLVEYEFDPRRLIRDICTSRSYQAAAMVDAPPASTFASAPVRRLSAEQLLDAIDGVTGVPTKHAGLPLGAHAARVAGADGNRFLSVFGRPDRTSACTCDRREEPTLSQTLHLINGSTVNDKIVDDEGRLARLLSAGADDAAILDELFLAAYARFPSIDEKREVLDSVQSSDQRTEAWEDAFWAVLNSKEFLFNH